MECRVLETAQHQARIRDIGEVEIAVAHGDTAYFGPICRYSCNRELRGRDDSDSGDEPRFD
jgi:hypothetical protein